MAGELIGEILGEGIVALTASNDKRERGCGCLIILLLIGFVIAGLFWVLTHTVTQQIIVTNKLSDTKVEYRELDSNITGVEKISAEIYDKVKINDTIQIKLVK